MAEIQSARQSDTDIAYILYAMHAIAPFTLWTLALVAVFFGFMTRDRVKGTYLDSHFGWLQHTFWFGLVFLVVATTIFVLSLIGILFLPLLWFINRTGSRTRLTPLFSDGWSPKASGPRLRRISVPYCAA